MHGKEITIALCGDLWDCPERFRTDQFLIWPVYVNYTIEEWNQGTLDDYAAQAALVADDVLMINSIDHEPANHGGSFHLHNGKIIARIPFDREGILVVEI